MREERQDVLSFWKKYSLLDSSSFMKGQVQAKAAICRYCKKDASQTTFTEITHLLPELLGRNNIYTYDECDACNHLFSKYESHLAIFIRPFMTLLGVTTKHNVPAFQSRSVDRDPLTVTSLTHQPDGTRALMIGPADDLYIDANNNVMGILFRHPPFIPLHIYKSLVKIGMSLLPSEFDVHNQQTFDWLVNDNVDLGFISFGFMTTLTQGYVQFPSAELYRAIHLRNKTEEFPEYTLILRFANQVFQVFLPFTDELKAVHNQKKNLTIELFPSIAYDRWKDGTHYQIKPFAFGIDHAITSDQRLHFKFNSIEWHKDGI